MDGIVAHTVFSLLWKLCKQKSTPSLARSLGFRHASYLKDVWTHRKRNGLLNSSDIDECMTTAMAVAVAVAATVAKLSKWIWICETETANKISEIWKFQSEIVEVLDKFSVDTIHASVFTFTQWVCVYVHSFAKRNWNDFVFTVYGGAFDRIQTNFNLLQPPQTISNNINFLTLSIKRSCRLLTLVVSFVHWIFHYHVRVLSRLLSSCARTHTHTDCV